MQVNMYNLLVTAMKGAWDAPNFVFSRDRIFESTPDSIRQRFAKIDSDDVAALIRLPTLFAYEIDQALPARVGWLKAIEQLGK
ncbi:MAG TPA: hypothetical protein VGF99_13720, partial [Myxococcota bacterium]